MRVVDERAVEAVATARAERFGQQAVPRVGQPIGALRC